MAPETVQASLAPPLLAPVGLDGGDVQFVSLDELAYRAASFLDGRLIAEGRAVTRHPWADVRVAAPAPRRTHFIFHVGHCGSTLLSRLLGAHESLFSVREPALLRELASGRLGEAGLGPVLGLAGRVWRPGQTALVKATSFVTELAPDLMKLSGGKALLLYVTPPAYLRGILAGPNSRDEAARLASSRQARIEQRLGRALSVRGEGEVIAMSWLCEAAALHDLAEAWPGACLALDFDRCLADLAGWLAAALRHLDADPAMLDIASLLSGPLMRRYAKGPEHAYDPGLRAAVLEAGGHAHPQSFHAGLAWLQREAVTDERVARILKDSASRAGRSLAPVPLAR